jgi:hypothetical protein
MSDYMSLKNVNISLLMIGMFFRIAQNWLYHPGFQKRLSKSVCKNVDHFGAPFVTYLLHTALF